MFQLKWLWENLKGYRPIYAVALTMSIVNMSFFLTGPIITEKIISIFPSFFIGIFLSVIGFLLLLTWIIKGIINKFIISNLLILATLLFVSGIIIFILGLIGDYVGRIYMCINNSPQYVIKKRIENRGTKNEK